MDLRSPETLFLGSHVNRIDAKGRVAVPAEFRRVLETERGLRLFCLKGLYEARLECGGADFISQYLEEIETLAPFSDEREMIEEHILGSVRHLPFDGEGRVVLPDDYRTHAGLSERALFQGRGKRFVILDPEKSEKRQSETREPAREAIKRIRMLNGGGRG